MEDWKASVSKILSSTATNLEHGFNLPPPGQADVNRRTSSSQHKGHRSSAVDHVSEPTAPAHSTGRQSTPVYAPVELVDLVFGKIVEKVESLREAVKGCHTELDLERHKREMKERELYLNLKAEMNERIAQLMGDWRKSEATLRRAIMELEEKQLLIPLTYPTSTRPLPTHEANELSLGMQEKWQERMFELEATVNSLKRAQEERGRRQENMIAQKVQEEVERSLERLRGLAREAGRESASEQLRLRSSNADAVMDERWQKFQELSNGNQALVMDLGNRLAQLSEQMKLDVLGQRETLKRDLDAVMEQQFLLRDWKDGLDNKMKINNDNWEARMAKMQQDILGAVNAFKQQVLEDERKVEQTLQKEVACRTESVLEKARAAVQGALKEFTVASTTDHTQVQKQIAGLKGQVDDLHTTVHANRTEVDQRLQELQAESAGYGQRLSNLMDRSNALTEAVGTAIEESKKAKRESKALREELVEGSASMERLGRDVEGHLRGFGKSMKEQAKQVKEALTMAKECEAAVATVREIQQQKLERLGDELDRANTQLKFFIEGQEEARLRLDRVERRADAAGNGATELKSVTEDTRSKVLRLEGVFDEVKHVLGGLQSRPIGMTQAEVTQTMKALKVEIRDFAEQLFTQMITQSIAKLQVDLHDQLYSDLGVLVADVSARNSEMVRQAGDLQTEVTSVSGGMKALQKRLEMGQEEQGRLAVDLRQLRASFAEFMDISRVEASRLERIGGEVDGLQGVVKALEARPIGDVRQNDLEEQQTRLMRAMEEIKTALQRASSEKLQQLEDRLSSLRSAMDVERQSSATQLAAAVAQHQSDKSALLTDVTALVDPLRESLRSQESKVAEAFQRIEEGRRLHDKNASSLTRLSDELHQEIKQLEHATMAEAVKGVQQSCKTLAEDISALRTRQEASVSDQENIKLRQQQTSNEVALLQTSLQECNAQLASQHGAIQKELDRFGTLLLQAQAALKQQANEMETTGSDVKLVRQRTEGIMEEITVCLRDCAAMKVKMNAMAEEMEALQTKGKIMGETKADLQQLQDTCTKMIKDIQSTKNAAAEDVASCRKDCDALRGSLEHRLQSLETGANSLQRRVEDMERGVRTAAQASCAAAVEDSRQVAVVAEKRVAGLCTQMQELETAIQNSNRDWKATSLELREAQAQIQRTIASVQAQVESVEALQGTTARSLTSHVESLGAQIAALRERMSQDMAGLRTDLASQGHACQRNTAECTAAVDVLRGTLERRATEQETSIQELKLANDTQGRMLTAAREEHRLYAERCDKVLGQRLTSVEKLAMDATDMITSLRTKVEADVKDLQNGCETVAQGLGRLSEAQKAATSATAEANEKITRWLSTVESNMAQASESTSLELSRQGDELRNHIATVTALREAQERMQMRCRASEAEWGQKFIAVEAAVQQCKSEMERREDDLVESFQALHSPLLEATEQIKAQTNGLVQRIDGLAGQLELLNVEHKNSKADFQKEVQALEQQSTQQHTGVTAELQDIRQQLQQLALQLKQDGEQIQILSALEPFAEKVETELQELRECVDAIQQESQATVETIQELTSEVDRCLDGNREVQVIRERLGLLQQQADKLVHQKLKRMAWDVAVLKRAYDSLQENAAVRSNMQEELAVLTRALWEMQQEEPQIGGSDDESIGSEVSDHSHVSYPDAEGEGSAPSAMVRRSRLAHAKRQHIPLPQQMPTSFVLSEAAMDSLTGGLQQLKGTPAASQALTMGTTSPPLPANLGTSQPIDEAQGHLQPLHPSSSLGVMGSVPSAGLPLPTSLGTMGATRDPLQTMALPLDPRVTWAEPLCDESLLSDVNDAPLDDSQTTDVIENVTQGLASLRGLLTQTQGTNVAGTVAGTGTPSTALVPQQAMSIPYPSDGESSDGMGTSDRLIAGIQSELSSVAGLLALTYGRVGQPRSTL